MKFFIFLCLISAGTCLKCKNSNITKPEVDCSDEYCYEMVVISGSGDSISYSEIEGCGTDVLDSAIIKPFNITCKDGIQKGNTTIFGEPYLGILYCCKNDLCNTEIPGFTYPSTLAPSSTTPKATTNNGVREVSKSLFYLLITITLNLLKDF